MIHPDKFKKNTFPKRCKHHHPHQYRTKPCRYCFEYRLKIKTINISPEELVLREIFNESNRYF